MLSGGTVRQRILNDIVEERQRQVALAIGGDTNQFDRRNSANDWIAYITAYLGRAAQNVDRNVREGQDFRSNLIKVAALCLAAIESHDTGGLLLNEGIPGPDNA